MKEYICPKELCNLYDACPFDRRIVASEQSYPDSETGEVLYSAACMKTGETFCDLHANELVGDDAGEYGVNPCQLDARCLFSMMNSIFDGAEKYFATIIRSVGKHGTIRFLVPEEKIESLKELLPHQAEEIETTLRGFADDGFEPHQFLIPEEAFMDSVLLPFSGEFFSYREKLDGEYGCDDERLNEINGKKARFRKSWGELTRTLDRLLPGKSSVLKLFGAVKEMLGLFEKRLAFGKDFNELPAYDYAFRRLNESLMDVAADLRQQNMERINAAEEKRKRKSENLSQAQAIAGCVVEELRSKPLNVDVCSLEKDALAQIKKAVSSNKREKSFMTDGVLAELFDVSENTPYNWRNDKAAAPEGFHDAFEKKDYKAMKKIAELYKLSRKADAMKRKDTVRNMSEEQMYREGVDRS